MENPALYLASRSPRRQALLAQIGVRSVPLNVDVDESPQAGEPPDAYVRRLACAKAEAGLALRAAPEGVVLGADTAVIHAGVILGKPEGTAAAEAMLQRLGGRSHQVMTAVAVRGSWSADTLSVSTVEFRALNAAEIRAYVATGEGADKAGGYAIQGLAALFVARLTGSYSGVVGLPLCETAELLRRAGLKVLGVKYE